MIGRIKTAFVTLAVALSLIAGTLPASANLTWEGDGGEGELQNVTWE